MDLFHIQLNMVCLSVGIEMINAKYKCTHVVEWKVCDEYSLLQKPIDSDLIATSFAECLSLEDLIHDSNPFNSSEEVLGIFGTYHE